MKIFILLSRVPYPLEKGDKLRAFNHIKFLSKKNDIILCALNDSKIYKQEAVNALTPFCKSISIINLSKFSVFINIIKALFTGKPLQVGYFYSKKAKKEIDKLIKETNPDYIFCQLIRVSEYVKDYNISKTLDYQDVFSKGIERRIKVSPFYLKPFLKLEYNRLKKYENYIFKHFDNKIIISIPDRELIPHYERDKIIVIPNGVDTEYFRPVNCKKQYDLLFTGNMGYPPNIFAAEYFVKEILDYVYKKYPDIKLLIAGANPSKKIFALKSKNVDVAGWVKDMRECYAKAHIFVAPMKIGTGLQNKLLEAMAMQIPCITSPLANQSLQAKQNKEILIANTTEQYAEHIFFLLGNKQQAQKIALNAYNMILEKYNWTSLTDKLEKVIKN
jgi:sugar transferase (PEP-CTERM/EpsH1 system associated)